jgi:hypothetical protein
MVRQQDHKSWASSFASLASPALEGVRAPASSSPAVLAGDSLNSPPLSVPRSEQHVVSITSSPPVNIFSRSRTLSYQKRGEIKSAIGGGLIPGFPLSPDPASPGGAGVDFNLNALFAEVVSAHSDGSAPAADAEDERGRLRRPLPQLPLKQHQRIGSSTAPQFSYAYTPAAARSLQRQQGGGGPEEDGGSDEQSGGEGGEEHGSSADSTDEEGGDGGAEVAGPQSIAVAAAAPRPRGAHDENAEGGAEEDAKWSRLSSRSSVQRTSGAGVGALGGTPPRPSIAAMRAASALGASAGVSVGLLAGVSASAAATSATGGGHSRTPLRLSSVLSPLPFSFPSPFSPVDRKGNTAGGGGGVGDVCAHSQGGGAASGPLSLSPVMLGSGCRALLLSSPNRLQPLGTPAELVTTADWAWDLFRQDLLDLPCE